MRTLMGNCHQGNSIFGFYAGTECTAIAFIFLLHSFFKPIQQWHADDLTNAMLLGTEVNAMQHALHYGNGGETAFLSHSDLPQQIKFNSNDLHVDFHVDEFFVYCSKCRFIQIHVPCHSIENAINEGLTISHHMLLTIGADTFTLIFQDDVSYIVDSHSRNAQGMACREGVAVVLSFSCISDLLAYLHTMYNNLFFNLTPIYVSFQQSQTSVLSGQEFHAATTASSQKLHAPTKVLQGNSHQGYPQSGMKASSRVCSNRLLQNSLTFPWQYSYFPDKT